MSQNTPLYPWHQGGQPSNASASQAPQPTSTNIAPTMQAQQAAYQQNAALQSNPMDILAQMNISPEQFMQVAQLLQSGAIQLPTPSAPVPAQAAAPAPAASQPSQLPTAQHPAPAAGQSSQLQTIQHPHAVQHNTQDIDMDKEEGEVDEAEEQPKTSSDSRGFKWTPPKGPRKRSRSPQPRFDPSRRSSQQYRARSPAPAAAGSRRSSGFGRPSSRGAGAPNNGKAPQAPNNGKAAQARNNGKAPQGPSKPKKQNNINQVKMKMAKDFMVRLYENGSNYTAIATQLTPSVQSVFADYWDFIGLPRDYSIIPGIELPVVKAPPKPAASQSRDTYLAKLAAAKSSKQGPNSAADKAPAVTPASNTNASKQEPKPTSPEAKPAGEKPSIVATSSSPQTPQPSGAKRTIDRDLVRQKIKALQAAQEAKTDAARNQEVKHEPDRFTLSTSAGDPAAAPTGLDKEKEAAIAAALLSNVNKPGSDSTQAPQNLAGPSDSTQALQNLAGSSDSTQPQTSSSTASNQVAGLPGLFTAGITAGPRSSPAEVEGMSQAQQPAVGPLSTAGSSTTQRVFPQGSATATGANISQRPFGMTQKEAVVIIDSDNESEDGVKTNGSTAAKQNMRTIPTGLYPMYSMQHSGSPINQSPAPQTPGSSSLSQTQKAKELADLKRKLAEMETKRQEKRNRTGGAFDTNAAPSASASEAGTPSNNQTFAPLPPNPEMAVDSGLSAPSHVSAPAQDVEQSLPAAAYQANEADDAEIDDDDDLDDIYETSGPLAQRAPPAVSTSGMRTAGAVEEDDDSESAMDTSSDTTDELNEYYGLTDKQAEVVSAPPPAEDPMPAEMPPPAEMPLPVDIPMPIDMPMPQPPPVPMDETAEDLDDDSSALETDIDAVDFPPDNDHVDDKPVSQYQPSAQAAAETESAKATKWTPYESPLRIFKDFRYHPVFLETVAGGHKSLTYSHKIDPNGRCCPYETAGGKCNDPDCEGQTFKSMVLSDNELLKLMGADQTPAKTPEELKKWKAGLAVLIADIRSTHGQANDVELISRRIAQYRRDFVGDPTKTLLLD